MLLRLQKLIGTGGLLLASFMLVAANLQAEPGSPKISGHIETTYMYDFNGPSTPTVNLRSYDPTSNSFYLNAAHIAITGELEENVSYTVEIDYGNDAAITTGDDDVDIQEAYLNFPVGPLAVTAGKFVTYEGIEVIEGPDNPTISRGYLYGLAEAFGHVGAKAHIPLGEHVDVGAGVVNGRDKNTDNNKGKTYIWRIGFDFGDPFSVGFSGSHGSHEDNDVNSNTDEDNLTSYDMTGTIGIIPRLPIAFQALYAEQDNTKMNAAQTGTTMLGKWSGFGIQPTLELTEKFSIGMRAEYFDNLDIRNYTAANYTVAPTYKLNDAVTLRAEVRRDIVHSTVDAGPFFDDKGRPKGTATTGSLGASYSF